MSELIVNANNIQNIFNKLEEIRLSIPCSSFAMCSAIGISTTTMTRLKLGKSVSHITLFRLKEFLARTEEENAKLCGGKSGHKF